MKVNVDRALFQVDQDNTGAIGEDEFVHFFKAQKSVLKYFLVLNTCCACRADYDANSRADDIQKRLKGFASHDPVTVDVVTYSALPNPHNEVGAGAMTSLLVYDIPARP